MLKNQSNDIKAMAIILWQVAFTFFALFVSFKGENLVWFLGQVLLAISIFQWFVIHHDLAHDSFFKTRVLNKIFGHISSIPTLIPFFSFKLAHHQHHVWTGWRDKDPSNPENYFKTPPSWIIRIVNFCWKFWIPLMSPVFVIQNFWNMPRLFRNFKSAVARAGIVLSIVLVFSIYVFLFAGFGKLMLECWLTAFILYMIFSDLVLMSQHTDIEWQTAGKKEVTSFQYAEQSNYTRTIIYPKPVSRFLFYNFDRHGLHHQNPSIPTYQLGSLPQTPHLNVGWWEWLKKAKSLSAFSLLYVTPKASKS
ncbi:fatty acid desaturase [Marivirga sp. S37H4]|uniref:Fatty acid desaturase n=1 Tax=Marivirga aurantiaca TaxID=2802615 RepID=A0A935CBQ5_9BACT|nr:fatty acid desaturase [Marivirga aurantiaca]MBK6265498.1 fatty acid desaturase [Marivirga aurantiaca]